MTSKHPEAPPPRAASRSLLMLIGYLIAAFAVAVYAGGALGPATMTSSAQILGYFTATLAGAGCLGGLVLVLITARPDESGLIDGHAFRAHLALEWLSVLWLVTATAMVVVQAAADAGVPATRLLSSGQLGSALGASETARGWVAAAVCAAILTVGSKFALRWEWHVPLLIPAMIGVVAVPVNGNAGQGPDHDYATGAMIVFAVAIAVWAGMNLVAAVAPVANALRRRFDIVTVAAAAIALGYGAFLLTLLAGPGDLTGSGYGKLGLLAAVAVLIGLMAAGTSLRIDRVPPPLLGAGVAITTMAALAGMAVQTAPTLLAEQPTVWDVLLGYELPGAPTSLRLLTFWRFDVFLGIGALLLAGGYLLAVVKLRRRGDVWPMGRVFAWLAGCAAVVAATCSGVRSYGSAMFSVHMVEHMTLNMFAPVLLVLGAPVTLALRTLPSAKPGSPPGPREWITRLIHSSITTFLSHPVTAFVLFVGSLYAVYFTPLFDTLVRYHWGHELMAVHFLLTGYLFYWGIIGVDPGPRRLPFIGRLALLFAVMPFHAFFGIAMMTMTTTVGANFYRSLALPWVPNINDDQHLGGAIAWGSSEVPLVMVVIALVIQWSRQDRRSAVRSDRHTDAGYGDDQMVAYNNMLRELAKKR